MNGKDLKKEYGDYQTPDKFTYEICSLLKNKMNINPAVIVEPTSGIGNFIRASLDTFPQAKHVYGIEINSEYCKICRDRISDGRLQIINENFFSYKMNFLPDNEEILFVGNPPWATNSDLNFNLPVKENFKHFKGTDAITGASNFDICEYIILKIIENSIGKNVSIAMLCKTSVARSILLESNRQNFPIACSEMYTFNSSEIFGINASACLLYIKMSTNDGHICSCNIMDINYPQDIQSKIVVENGKLQTHLSDVTDLDGNCIFEWRQGVKHDCANVMELTPASDGTYLNRKKETVSIEPTLVFPLIKSSSFKKPVIKAGFSKYVIMTQKKTREETNRIEQIAPLTWKYLNSNIDFFNKRKSSIYKGAPPFSMFGVGDYSYAAYKVGISGFYKKPLFSLLYNEAEISHPVMLDDTSYYLSFDNYSDAYTCMLLLNSRKVQQFLLSISFQDAKRPYTKKVLQRVDIIKCLEHIDLTELEETEKELGLSKYITAKEYKQFASAISR